MASRMKPTPHDDKYRKLNRAAPEKVFILVRRTAAYMAFRDQIERIGIYVTSAVMILIFTMACLFFDLTA